VEVNTLCEKRKVTAGEGRELNVTAGGKYGDTVLYVHSVQQNVETLYCTYTQSNKMWRHCTLRTLSPTKCGDTVL